MTEQPPEADGAEPAAEDALPDDGAEQAPRGAVQGTGHPAVDEVLRSLERLDEQPVGDHVAIFENAHDTLRRTLAEGGGEGSPDRE